MEDMVDGGRGHGEPGRERGWAGACGPAVGGATDFTDGTDGRLKSVGSVKM